MILEQISLVATLLTLVVYFALPVVYGIIAPRWYKTQTGRVLMWLLAALAVAMLYITAGVFFGNHPLRVELRIVTLFVVLTAGIRFLAYMLQTQFSAVREKMTT